MVAKFVQWARIREETAKNLLEYFEWNYEQATDYYWREFILIY
jgi:hypothetical protein